MKSSSSGNGLTQCSPAVIIVMFFLLFPACPAPQPEESQPVRVVILSLDGMADWLLDRLLEEGRMPNLERLLAGGAAADHAVTSFPAKTAVAHALIWTGADPSHNGIHGNSLIPWPYSERTVVDEHTGFHAMPLRAEPVWAAAARQGKKVVVVQATQAAPFSYYLGEDARFPAPRENLIIFDGYIEGGLAEEVITEDVGFAPADDWQNLPEHEGSPLAFDRVVGETEFYFLIYDDPLDPVEGFDTLAVCGSEDGYSALAYLKPGPSARGTADRFSGPVEVVDDGKPTVTFFRLFELAPDGSEMLLYRDRVMHLICSDGELQKRVRKAAGGFTGNGASQLYAIGLFGSTLMQGGDGTAEERYLEAVRHSAGLSREAALFAMNNLSWDLLIDYLAFPDEQNHIWLGFVAEPVGDPSSEAAELIWPYLLETYELCDRYVGALMDSLPEDAVLIVVSDHGFYPADRTFFPNTVLRRAGLLGLTDEGEVDLRRTRAIYYPGGADFILINSRRFKDGVVSEEDVPGVRRLAEEALLSARDGNGDAIVTGIFDPREDRELGMDGPYAGDFYLQLAPGIYPSGFTGSEEIIAEMTPKGVHRGDPRARRMNSIFLIGGKPLKRQPELGRVMGVDIAPTICALMGIGPPADATGSAVEKILDMVNSR